MRLRIALLSANLFDIGGVENHIRFIGREFERLGHELMLFKPAWSERVVEARALDDGIPSTVVELGSSPTSHGGLRSLARFPFAHGFLKRIAYSTVARQVSRTIEHWSPDLIWQHDFTSSWAASRLLARRFPVVLTNHTGEYLFLRKLPQSGVLLRGLLAHYRAVIGPSRELTPTDHSNAVTIHNGVDLGYYSSLAAEERTALRRRLLGAADDRFVVLCPRRWAPTKGVIHLATALKKIATVDPRVLVAFAGSDYHLYPDYSRRIREELKGLQWYFRELGNLSIEPLRDWYRAADLVVIPSLMEAVSLAALEAMACGAPVLATAVGGMPELISDNETGLLVDPADPDALARVILRAARDPELLQSVAKRGLMKVRSEYGWDTIAKRTAHVLELCTRRNAGTSAA